MFSAVKAAIEGPDYSHKDRWIGRLATVVMMPPFLALCYGWGYIVFAVFGRHAHAGGIFAVGFVLALMTPMWIAQWFRGFPQQT